MSETPLVSVVIPHFQDLPSLELCLAALDAQTLSRDKFEIIVGDNASVEGEAAVARVLNGRAKLVIVSERGAGPARNGAVALARGEILAFTDCDCQPEPQWLTEGLAALSRHDFIGGGMRVLVSDPKAMTPTEAFEVEFAFNNEAYVTQKGFTVTANLFCARRVFDEVGGFRVGVSEDFDWSQRAIDAGYTIGYAPLALVGHPARRTWSELVRKWRRLNTETFAVFAARPYGRLRWMLRSCLLPLSALAHTPRVLTSRKLPSNRKLAALGILYRLRAWRLIDAFRLSLSAGK